MYRFNCMTDSDDEPWLDTVSSEESGRVSPRKSWYDLPFTKLQERAEQKKKALHERRRKVIKQYVTDQLPRWAKNEDGTARTPIFPVPKRLGDKFVKMANGYYILINKPGEIEGSWETEFEELIKDDSKWKYEKDKGQFELQDELSGDGEKRLQYILVRGYQSSIGKEDAIFKQDRLHPYPHTY